MRNIKSSFAFFVVSIILASAAIAAPKKVLHVYKLGNYSHKDAWVPVETMLDQLATEKGFTVSHVSNQNGLNQIDDFDLVVFNNAGQNSFSDNAIRAKIVAYMEGGGKAIGYHASSDHRGYWAWWDTELHSGTRFTSHGNSAFLLDLDPEIKKNPAMDKVWTEEGLGNLTSIQKTEIYILTTNPRGKPGVTMLQTVNKANTNIADHPFTWVKKIKQGEYVYTSLGHNQEDFKGGWIKKATWAWMRYLSEDNTPCCKTTGFEEYDAACKNPQPSACITTGISKVALKEAFVEFAPGSLAITYPNPYRVEVSNIKGETVIAQSHNGPNVFSLSEVKPGLYFVKVIASGKSVNKRVLIK